MQRLWLLLVSISMASIAVGQPMEQEPNNDFQHANPLVGATPLRIRGSVQDPGDYRDYYRGTLLAEGYIEVSLLSGDGEIRVQLKGVTTAGGQCVLYPGHSWDVIVALGRVGDPIFVDVEVASGSVNLIHYELLIEPYEGIPNYRGIIGGSGASQSDPILPTSRTGSGKFNFIQIPAIQMPAIVQRGSYVDPPAEPGFKYKMTNGGHFTAIRDFPTGFTGPFTVVAEGTNYGQFNHGDQVIFNGAGHTTFSILGIAPLTYGSPTAFPVKLDWDIEYADFTMEPANVILPDSIEALEGIGFSGSLDSLLNDDSDRYRHFNDEATLRAAVELRGTAPQSLSVLRFLLETRVGRPGLSQAISAFDFVAQTWRQVIGGIAPTDDFLVDSGDLENPTRFIGPNQQVLTRIEWLPINDEDPSQDGWLHDIDLARWQYAE